MLITESQMNINNNQFSSIDVLDNMNYLTEAESVYAPALVPIVENTNVGANLIRLEDIISFAESNGIEDLGYALTCVCEASQVEPSTIAFTVQAESVIADSDIASLVSDIINEGVTVCAIPANSNHAACQAVDIAVNSLIESGDTTLIDAIADDDYHTFFEAAADDELDSGSKHKAMTDLRTAASKEAHKTGVADREKLDGKLKKIWDKVKSGANLSRDWMAKQLDRLNAWMRDIQDKLSTVEPDKRGLLEKIKGKIASIIEVITRKLHNFVQANRGNITERKNPLD